MVTFLSKIINLRNLTFFLKNKYFLELIYNFILISYFSIKVRYFIYFFFILKKDKDINKIDNNKVINIFSKDFSNKALLYYRYIGKCKGHN
jgi:hypothetical protein